MLNVALVGFGYAGKTIHAPLIASIPELRLHTIVSTQPDTVRAAWPAVRVVATLADALEDPDVDLVVVATPNDLHAPMTRQALKAGRHVVVDKPFTVVADEARQLRELALRTGRLLSVFQNRRWDSDFLAVRQVIESGRLGTIGHFESRFNRFRPVVRDRWRERHGPGAGIWYDLGAHLIDQAGPIRASDRDHGRHHQPARSQRRTGLLSCRAPLRKAACDPACRRSDHRQ